MDSVHVILELIMANEPVSAVNSYMERWAAQLQEKGVGPLAAFLLRAHLPLTGILAHSVMFSEPFLKLLNFHPQPLYEFLNDRDAVRKFIHTLETNEQ